MLVAHPTAAQDYRFEADPVVTVRENFVACEVLSRLQRVMDNPRFLLTANASRNGTRLGLRPFRRAALHADGALATGH
jgi:hypothetical protein